MINSSSKILPTCPLFVELKKYVLHMFEYKNKIRYYSCPKRRPWNPMCETRNFCEFFLLLIRFQETKLVKQVKTIWPSTHSHRCISHPWQAKSGNTPLLDLDFIPPRLEAQRPAIPVAESKTCTAPCATASDLRKAVASKEKTK